MTDTPVKSHPSPSAPGRADDEIDLLDYLRVIWRAKWMISFLCVVAIGATVAIMLTRPRYYQSSVTIVPPLEMLQKEMSVGGLGAMGNSLLRSAIGGLGGSIAGIYVEILESRELADSIIDRFDLMEVYEDMEYRSWARKELKRNTKIDTTDDGAVKVSVQDRDPNRAAAMAKAYVEELDRQNKRLSGGQATSKRVFLENGLKEVEQKLSRIDSLPSREVQVQEMLYELLMRELELAKIEEARSMPTIQVLDEAVVSDLPVPRGTATKGVLAGVAAFMFGAFLAFAREYIVQARRREGEFPAARTQEATNAAVTAEGGAGTG